MCVLPFAICFIFCSSKRIRGYLLLYWWKWEFYALLLCTVWSIHYSVIIIFFFVIFNIITPSHYQQHTGLQFSMKKNDFMAWLRKKDKRVVGFSLPLQRCWNVVWGKIERVWRKYYLCMGIFNLDNIISCLLSAYHITVGW